eukprot:NODE_4466_length_434_cov_1181.179221_g3507_i0.p1 GENE.NODE_4466_length_434_cov_1181.179221_g3507_i0~~NODE_4466_length_434_cov_1181.179221_g3507_i0.p1  ORF type:complete len:107 (+),score=63.42 NODE_4466_length_434_cov_1181.179221_g3507_i0:32-322(+)
MGYLFKDIGSVGFDLWQVKAGTIFDNIIITDDEAEAKEFFDVTTGKTKDGEKKMFDKVEEEKRKKDEEERKKREAEDKKEAAEEEDEDEAEDKDEL